MELANRRHCTCLTLSFRILSSHEVGYTVEFSPEVQPGAAVFPQSSLYFQEHQNLIYQKMDEITVDGSSPLRIG